MNEYNRIVDELYQLSPNARLLFNSSIGWFDEYNNLKSHYNEYKTNNRSEGSVVIKRKISYFLSFEYSVKGGGERTSVMIYPEHMFEILDKFNYIRNYWFNPANNGRTFGMVNDKLVVLNEMENIKIHFPQDKVLLLEPTVKRDELGDRPACIMYIVSRACPVLITAEKFNGLLYTMSTLDMSTYANTALSMVALREGPLNRVDFSSSNFETTQPPTTGKAGRDFKFKQRIL